MSLLETIKRTIAAELGAEPATFSYPPNAALGDLSLACFELAKKEGKNPTALAQAMAERLGQAPALQGYLKTAKAVGPYVNFFIRPEFLAAEVIGAVKKEKEAYGRNDSGQGRKIMIEYSNGNTHKEYHVGHLRNISFGAAVAKLLAASGYETLSVSYINDFGIHVAKTIWEWKKKPAPDDPSVNKGYLLGQYYVQASRELEKEPEKKEEVGKIMKAIESRQGGDYELWQETRNWSIKYFDRIYKELDIKFSHIFYESEVIDAGRKIVDDLLAKGILKRSQGAIIADLETYGLGVLPIIRTDGTALYPVGDLELAKEKFDHYQINESLYVVDVRQSLYFQQLAKILELMGYEQKLAHLTYDFVTLPEGMMSSRTGQVITYEELKDKLLQKLVAETKKRHSDWTNSRVGMVARCLTISTIKFEMLKVGADKIITFNIEEAAKFDGFTACYIQYGYARLKSIVRKGGLSWFQGRPDLSLLQEAKEQELLMKIAKYPEIIALATPKYNPSEVAKYLFELVQLFNDYYHDINILKADRADKKARLALIKAVAQVLHNGFGILGLQTLEEM